MKKLAVSCLFFSCICLYSISFGIDDSIENKLKQADDFASQGYYSKAISLNETVALKPGVDRRIKAKAWYDSALMREEKQFEYKRALRTYRLIIKDYPEFELINGVKQKVVFLEEQLELYKEPLRVLSQVKYREKLDKARAEKEIAELKNVIREYPEFYKMADIYARLGNRYVNLSKWARAYFSLKKAGRLNPNLIKNSPLGRDLEIASSIYIRRVLLVLPFVLLFISIAFCVYLKPWKHFKPCHIKFLLFTIAGWIIVSIAVFSYPLISGIPEPEGLADPIISFLWFKPLQSPHLWMFLLYTFPGILITFFTAVGLAETKNPIIGSILTVTNSFIVTGALILLFYTVYCKDSHYYATFLFFKEEPEYKVLEYPEAFKDYPGVIKEINEYWRDKHEGN